MLAPPDRPPTLLKRVMAALAPLPRVTPLKEMGVSGTAVYGGYIQTRERSAKWQGSQRYVTIADMAVNTSIIAAGVHYFLNLIAHPRWTIEPADKSGPAQAAAELVDAALHDMAAPWSRVVRRAGTYRFYGFGVQEWTAKKRPDGRVGLASVEPRPQHTIERWAVADDGAVEGVFQRTPTTGALLGIPRSKFLYLVDDTLSDSPEGVGIFRHLGEPWERLKVYYELEARAFERDLRGVPVGRIPYTLIREAVKSGEIKEADAMELVRSMEEFVRLQVKQSDTSITLDSIPYYSQAQDGAKVAGVPQWGLELLAGGASGMAEVAGAIVRTQTEMARLLTCEHLMMGETTGNRALSEDKSRNLYLVANAVLGDIASGVRHDVVASVCMLNNIPDELVPRCEVEDVAFKDAEAVAGTLAKMALAGATLAPDDPVIEDVRGLLGVSAPAPISAEMVGLSAAPPTDEELAAAPPEDEGGVAVAKAYNPDQPRDDQGQWTEGGVSGGGGDGSGSFTQSGAHNWKGKSHDELLFIADQAIRTLQNPRASQKQKGEARTNGPRAVAELKARIGKVAPRTLYVSRQLLNSAAVRAWAASQGIASALPPGDMHVTVAFSREPVDWSTLTSDRNSITVAGGDRAVHQFPPRSTPNGALVLKFAAPALAARWQEFKDAGASWDFPNYQPHITITYAVPEADVAGIESYRGPLIFGPEKFAEVDDGWAGEVQETPTVARKSVPRRRFARAEE